MRGRRILQVMIGLTAGLAVSVLVLLAGIERSDDPNLLPSPFPAPRDTLTDHRSAPAPLPGDFDGVSAVFFGYTHCPDVCPVTMAKLAGVARRLDAEERERFRAILVTVDPARDTPARLAAYLAGFDSTFVGLTGSEEEIRDVAEAWGVYAQAPAGEPERPSAPDSTGAHGPHVHEGAAPSAHPPEGYLVDHTARAFLVDGRGRIVATLPASATVAEMTATVRATL